MIVMTKSFAGKTALITGAGRGIGRAIAVALAQAGCEVCLAARSLEQLVAVQSEIHASEGRAKVVQADLTRDDDLHALVHGCCSG